MKGILLSLVSIVASSTALAATTEYCVGVNREGDGQYSTYSYEIFCSQNTNPTYRAGGAFMFQFKSDQKIMTQAVAAAKAAGFDVRDTAQPFNSERVTGDGWGKRSTYNAVALLDNSVSMGNKPKEIILFNGSSIVNYTKGTKIKYGTKAVQVKPDALPDIAEGDVQETTVINQPYIDEKTLEKNGFTKEVEFRIYGPYSKIETYSLYTR